MTQKKIVKVSDKRRRVIKMTELFWRHLSVIAASRGLTVGEVIEGLLKRYLDEGGTFLPRDYF